MSATSGVSVPVRRSDPAAEPGDDAGTVLAVEDLHVELGRRLVLRDVNLTIGAREFVGLVGPNGAGKTTLLRSVLGLLRPKAGRIRVAGTPVRAGASGIGYVPQRHEFTWDFPISVRDAVMTGRTGRIGPFRRPGVDDWRAVAEALDRVRLTDLSRRPVGELSGGQRQRVLVARALALRPRMLLLDEPFTGLDLPTQDLLADLFAELGRQQAVLMATHDLPAAMHGCDRLILLNRTVVAAGRPRELREHRLWTQTFGVSERSPLFTALGMTAASPPRHPGNPNGTSPAAEHTPAGTSPAAEHTPAGTTAGDDEIEGA